MRMLVAFAFFFREVTEFQVVIWFPSLTIVP